MKTTALLAGLASFLGLASLTLAACGGSVSEDPMSVEPPILPLDVVDSGPSGVVDASIDVSTCGAEPTIECGYGGGGDCTVSVVCVDGEWTCGAPVCASVDAGPPGCGCPDDEPGCACGAVDGGEFDGDPPTTACGADYVEMCQGVYCICVPGDGGVTTSSSSSSSPSSSCGCPPDDQDCGCGVGGASSSRPAHDADAGSASSASSGGCWSGCETIDAGGTLKCACP